MEDDFGAENLEDGEMWLPSDFFSMDEVQVPAKFESGCSSSKPFCMEDFSQLFSSFTFLDHGVFKPLQPLQRVKQVVGDGGVNVAGGGAADDFLCGCGTGTSWTGCPPTYRYQHLNRVQAQVEDFIGVRACAIQMQQRTRFGPNRVLPGLRMGGHGGTGVFLPRNFGNVPTATVPRNQNQRRLRKRHVRMNRHEIELPPRKILLNKRQQEECYVAANVFLPYDSTS